MILTRISYPGVHFLNKNFVYCRYLSTDRSETISAALKKFYLKVHPDLFTQYPKEKVRHYKRFILKNDCFNLRMSMKKVYN
jgi:hypothetical protein